MGEDLECLCQIMRTVGPRLDHAKAKVCAYPVQSLTSLNYVAKTFDCLNLLYSEFMNTRQRLDISEKGVPTMTPGLILLIKKANL